MYFAYTEASKRALEGLRDLSMLKWYIVPIFGLVIYVYTKEIKNSRENGNWDPILAALVLFLMTVLFNSVGWGILTHLERRLG